MASSKVNAPAGLNFLASRPMKSPRTLVEASPSAIKVAPGPLARIGAEGAEWAVEGLLRSLCVVLISDASRFGQEETGASAGSVPLPNLV